MKQFIKELEVKNIYYVIENGRIIITEKNKNVNLFNLTELDNIQFNNLGHVYLPILITMGSNIQFNNWLNVEFYNLQSMGSNIQFNNGGDVWFNNLTTIGDNIQFDNDKKIYFTKLSNLPNTLKNLRIGKTDFDLKNLPKIQ